MDLKDDEMVYGAAIGADTGKELSLTEEENKIMTDAIRAFTGTKLEAALGQALSHIGGMYKAGVLPEGAMHAVATDLAEITRFAGARAAQVKEFARTMDTVHDRVTAALKARDALPPELPAPNAAAVHAVALSGETKNTIHQLAGGDEELEKNIAATLVALNAVKYAPEEHKPVMISAIGHLAEQSGVTLDMMQEVLEAAKADLDALAGGVVQANAPFSTTVQ